MKTAYFDMFSGVSGDMVLGALVDCGLPVEVLTGVVEALGLEGIGIEAAKCSVSGIEATQVHVRTSESHHHRGLAQIRGMIESSSLDEKTRELALRIFQRLGEAEAHVHGVGIEEIHFHEVGALDSIADIVGAAAGFVHLGIERCYAGAFRFGNGFVEFSHGRLPLPVPAVAHLTAGCPCERTDVPSELTTPTGAAIVTTLVAKEDFEPRGPHTFHTAGYGRGGRDLGDRPNLLRLMLGEEARGERPCGGTVMMECNIDDMSPEYYDHLIDKLFEQGAHEVFLSSVQMKKNRPGVRLHVLADEKILDTLAGTVLTESSTIGLRHYPVDRITLERERRTVVTPWGEVRIKVVTLPGGGSRAKPEYDDLREIARREKLPLLTVAARVEALLAEE